MRGKKEVGSSLVSRRKKCLPKRKAFFVTVSSALIARINSLVRLAQAVLVLVLVRELLVLAWVEQSLAL
jgi:hypothetical protein